MNVISPLLLFLKNASNIAVVGGRQQKPCRTHTGMEPFYCALIGKGCAAPSTRVECYVPPAYGGFVWLGLSWDPFHILPICFLRQRLGMSPFPALWEWLSALSQKEEGVLGWQSREWFLEGKTQPADTLRKLLLHPPALTNAQMCCQAHLPPQVLGLKAETGARKDEMHGKIRSCGYMWARKGTLQQKKLHFYSGGLLLFCVSFALRWCSDVFLLCS